MADDIPLTIQPEASVHVPNVGDTVLGKYRLEAPVGVGGMGVVLSATHTGLGHRVAIKFVKGSASPDAHRRFEREARIMASLKSEHTVRVYDAGHLDDGTPFLIMELLEGHNLADEVRRRGRIPVAEAVDHVLGACEALAEAHARGVVHRDIKPSNLFLAAGAGGALHLKVLDFGISRMHGGDARDATLTDTSSLLGSPLYMSPEQLRRAKDVDGRSDIWSLGIVLYQLLTGAPPFRGDGFSAICAAIVADEPASICAVASNVPVELEQIILRCLRKQREFRWANVGELAAALAPFAGPLGQPLVSRILHATRQAESTAPVPEPLLTSASTAALTRGGTLEHAPNATGTHGATSAAIRDFRSRSPVWPWLVLSGAVLAVVGGAGWTIFRLTSPNAIKSAPATTALSPSSDGRLIPPASPPISPPSPLSTGAPTPPPATSVDITDAGPPVATTSARPKAPPRPTGHRPPPSTPSAPPAVASTTPTPSHEPPPPSPSSSTPPWFILRPF